jgi:DNA-binding GntR family transcriptional regulator
LALKTGHCLKKASEETTKLNDSIRKIPNHEVTYQQIRDMILFGDLAPGQAVTIQGLASLMDAGVTPVREAIRRLTAEGALQFLGNRRVCVPELTRAQHEELEFARLNIEPELARIAIRNMNNNDIDELTAIDKTLNEAIHNGDVQGYLLQNHRFHFALYNHANARILLDIANMLWLRVGPSLRVVCGRVGTYNLPDRHEQALAAMQSGDADGVAQAIREDIRRGMDQIRQAQNDENSHAKIIDKA